MMSDQPLFQNTDQQESAYAPQQLPDGTTGAQAANLDDRSHEADTSADEIGVPAAGAGLLSQAGGGFGGTSGLTNPAAGPAVAAAARDDETAGPDPSDE